jgi:hypothetical protein
LIPGIRKCLEIRARAHTQLINDDQGYQFYVKSCSSSEGLAMSTLQIILELCIPEKELAKTHSQISFVISKVIQELQDPKGNYENHEGIHVHTISLRLLGIKSSQT